VPWAFSSSFGSMRRVSKREGSGCAGCPWNAVSGNGSGSEC